MTFITRTQHVQNDTVSLLAVQGKGTASFVASGQPDTLRSNFGVVLSGDLRVTKSDNAGGYFLLLTGVSPRSTDRRRTFFRGDALVRFGSNVVTLDNYWKMLCIVHGE